MMNDNNINFYDVVNEAENYFKIHNKGKGSGWKGYQRWKNANEYKYFPSGDRAKIDPFFTSNSHISFLKNNNITPQSRMFDNGWEELGPSELTNLTGHYSAGLGRIEDHYVDPSNANRIYIGSRSGGFWRTLDGGENWSGGLTDFLPGSGVNTIGVSPANSSEVLINVRNSSNGNSHGVYRSTDAGNTWTLTNFNPVNVGFGGLGDDFKIYEIRYHPTVANLVFIGTSKGIYKSTDNLATTNWTRLLNYGDIVEIAFHPTNSNIIYLYDSYYWGGYKNVVMRSTNQGISYVQSNTILGNNDNTSVHLSVSPACANCIYFASDNGVWKSTDNGINFTFLNNPPEGCGGFTVSDTDNTKMIYGYVDIEASFNDGASFNRVTRWSLGNTNGDTSSNQSSFETSTNYVHADLHPAKSVNGVFYIGTDGLFCKSEDNGTTWEIIGQGIAVRENYKLGVSQSNHYRSISGSQDNGTSIKTENGWIEFYGADGMEGFIHPLNDDWMIGSLQYGGRRRTKDGGYTQDGVTPSGTGDVADWEAPICYDPNNQMTVYDFRTSVFRSENFGDSWTNVGSPTFTGDIDEAAIAENNSNIIIVSKSESIEKSTNGGITWASIRSNLPNEIIQDIAFDPNDDDTIIVTYATYQNNNQKVYISTNGGITWSNITHNLGNMPIHTVVIDHTEDSNIYLGAEIGVYTKPMNGNTWSLYSTNLANTTVQELEIVYGSNTIKAVTWGRGLWEYSLAGRNDFPSILTTKITDQPTNEFPKFGFDQIVTSTIEYDDTLTDVHVAWSIGNPVFDNTISMSNTTGNIWVSNTAIPEFPMNTKIYFKVLATGSNNDTSETYKFMYTVKPFEYCSAQSNSSTFEHITNVTFNTINNTTVATNYSDFTAISTEVNKGSTYDFIASYSNNYESDQLIVWFDFNGNASFTDLGEEFAFPMSAGTNSPFTQAINIPLDAILGNIRMRVRLNDTNGGSNSSPCGSSTYGEVEDYTIVILDQNIGVLENDFLSDLAVYPNPTNGELNIKLGNNYTNVKVKISTVLGETILVKKYTEIEHIKLQLNANSGIYLVQIETQVGKKAVFKMVLN